MTHRVHWEKQYAKPIDQIPWEIEKPPKELVTALKGQTGRGKTALDVACGTGNYSRFLAEKGFQVTGVDLSRKALTIAQEKTKSKKANSKIKKSKIRFIHGDVLNLSQVLHETFDFILDYSLLHHIPHGKTKAYARQFQRLLKPGGTLLLVCYSTRDSRGRKTQTGKHGNHMFYRTKNEIQKAYAPLTIIQYKTARLGKKNQHAGHCFIFQKMQ